MPREIVAALIGRMVTTDPVDIKSALKCGQKIRLLSRREVEVMGALDLGKNWEDLSDSRTICIQNDDGTFIKAGETT